MIKFKRIAIDAGHGGKDSGAYNAAVKVKESDVALAVAKRIKKMFTSLKRKKMLTRSTDVYVELNDRWRKVNEWGADVSLCIHCNSTTDNKTRGVEVYYNQPGSEKDLAVNISKSISKALDISNRGAKKYDWAMTKYPNCPAVLIEIDFVSNNTFATLTKKKAYIKKISKAIWDGVRATEK